MAGFRGAELEGQAAGRTETARHNVETEKRMEGGGFQVYTDPSNNEQYSMKPGHPEGAIDMSGASYKPGGAARIGQPMGAAAGGTVDTMAKGIANYQMAPLSSSAMRGPWGQVVMNRVLELNPQPPQTTGRPVGSAGLRGRTPGRHGALRKRGHRPPNTCKILRAVATGVAVLVN